MPAPPAPKPKLNIPAIVAEIHRCPKITKTTSGLIPRSDSWYLVFGNEAEKTAMRSLYTTNLPEAQRLRDLIFAKARKAGRGGQSKLEKMATEVLSNPDSMKGFKFKVLMGGATEHHTLEQARQVRAQRAKAILARRKMA